MYSHCSCTRGPTTGIDSGVVRAAENNCNVHSAEYYCPVAPHAGAWIETAMAAYEKRHGVSPPTRGRGSKPGPCDLDGPFGGVAPHAGAWIETGWGGAFGCRLDVAPTRRRGAKPAVLGKGDTVGVAPRGGIETGTRSTPWPTQARRSPVVRAGSNGCFVGWRSSRWLLPALAGERARPGGEVMSFRGGQASG